jgi:hypothetical protein
MCIEKREKLNLWFKELALVLDEVEYQIYFVMRK